MSILETIILATIQGITEYVPVSSSGHLVLVRELCGWSDEYGVAMDVALHAASLLAVVFYFHKDLFRLLMALLQPARPHAKQDRKMIGLLIVATIPAALCGPFLEPVMSVFRHAWIVGLIMIGTASWFILCERIKSSNQTPLTALKALGIGLAQVCALLPGASRSGLTIGAGLLSGQARADAARFSFFMALPTIAGAVLLEGIKIAREPCGLDPAMVALGTAVCFAVSLASIHFCMKLFRKHPLTIFTAYLFIAGGIMLVRQLV